MWKRITFAYAERVRRDPTSLAYFREMEATLQDSANLGMYGGNKNPATGEPYPLSAMASILGISRQSVHARVKAGEVVAFQRDQIKAAGEPLVRVADVRAAAAAVLAQAGIEQEQAEPVEVSALSRRRSPKASPGQRPGLLCCPIRGECPHGSTSARTCTTRHG